jgi:23S rRNA (cytosine1962-C5)-methyltransferase
MPSENPHLTPVAGLLQPAYFAPIALANHELIDSGDGWKLERYGARLISRPDPQALWKRRLELSEWAKADLRFDREEPKGGLVPAGVPAGKGGVWRGKTRSDWTIDEGPLTFVLKPTRFKHVGLFPEQATNWQWIRDWGRALAGARERPQLLNLFGYTGEASLVAHEAGFDVTHVDASRTTLGWVKENLEASGKRDDSLRLILDDALGFARREVRRGNTYQGILLDPPHYGRGPKGEKWQLEDKLAELLATVGELLAERSFCILSTYAVGYSPLAFQNMFAEMFGADQEVALEAGELVIPEQGGRLLPCGFCARLSRGPLPSSGA